MNSRNPSLFAICIFLFLGATWGGSFVAIKSAIDSVPPFTAAAARVLVATVFLAILFGITGKKTRLPLRNARPVWVAGLFAQAIPFAFLFWGERFVSAGLAGVLNGTVPLWTFLLGMFFLRKLEKFTPIKFVGLCISVFGVGMIFKPVLSFSSQPDEIAGLIAVFFMSISYAIGTLATRWVLANDPKVTFASNVFQQHVASLLFLAVLSWTQEPLPSVATWKAHPLAIFCIVYLGIFSTAIGLYLYYYLIHLWGAVRASAVSYMIPIFSLFWDYVFFSHVPSAPQVYGTIAILAGLLLIQLNDWRIAFANRRAARANTYSPSIKST